jgi:hypothetical protein
MSGHKLNHPTWSQFPNFDTYYRSSHIGCYSWNFKISCPDSESPENLSLDKSCLTQFGPGPLTLLCAHILFWV